MFFYEPGVTTRTTESRATKFTPLKLLYGEEAMTPEELRHGSYRTEAPDEDIKATSSVQHNCN